MGPSLPAPLPPREAPDPPGGAGRLDPDLGGDFDAEVRHLWRLVREATVEAGAAHAFPPAVPPVVPSAVPSVLDVPAGSAAGPGWDSAAPPPARPAEGMGPVPPPASAPPPGGPTPSGSAPSAASPAAIDPVATAPAPFAPAAFAPMGSAATGEPPPPAPAGADPLDALAARIVQHARAMAEGLGYAPIHDLRRGPDANLLRTPPPPAVPPQP